MTNRAVSIVASNSIGKSEAEACTLTILGLPTTIPGSYLAAGTVDGAKARLDLTTSQAGGFSVSYTDIGGTSTGVKGGLTKVTDESGPTPVPYWLATCAISTKTRGILNLELVFDPAFPNQVTGRFIEPGTSRLMGTITGYRNIWSKTSPASSYAGFYSALMTPSVAITGDQDVPQGTGTLSFTVTGSTGGFSVTAYSAEGVKHTSAGFVGPDGEAFLFASAPTVGSLLSGTPKILPSSGDNFATNTLEGSLAWSKLPAATTSTTRLYRFGFDSTDLTLLGGKYTAPATGQLIMDLQRLIANPNATLAFSQGGLLAGDVPALDFNIANPSGAIQKVTVPLAGSLQNPAKISVSLNAATGEFSGPMTVANPVTSLARPVGYQGRITRNGGGYHAQGFFLLPQLPQPGETLKTSPLLSGQVILSPIR